MALSNMSKEEWEEIAQTIPSKDDAFIQKYMTGREALIAEEKKSRSGMYTRRSAQRVPHH
jgi:adenosine deaminase CECR1